ncbi:MAG: DUF2863 family protein [Betaproteobacteria bacterium]|nr:DUF2863 family protein [Betaproteobacteria bacterium]
MKTSPSSRRGRASREADRLVELAEGLAQSGSRAEDRFWETQLDLEIDGLLSSSDEGSLNAALDRLADRESRAYEELADAIEGRVEHGQVKASDGERDTLLIAAPVLAWSRLPLPTRTLGKDTLETLRKAMSDQVLARWAASSSPMSSTTTTQTASCCAPRSCSRATFTRSDRTPPSSSAHSSWRWTSCS